MPIPDPVVPHRERTTGLRFLPWLAVACLAVVCACLGQLYLATRASNAVLVEQQKLAELELRNAQQQLEAERLIARHQLADATQSLEALQITVLDPAARVSPQARAVVVWNPSMQDGVFKAEKMPPPAADQEYELWAIDPSQPTPVSAGRLVVAADGTAHVQIHPATPVASAARFTVTRERQDGAPRHSGPQGPVVLVSD